VEEIEWDWLELKHTSWDEPAYALVGARSQSGRFRVVLCKQTTLGHLAGALHEILTGLGGTARIWRVDRMAPLARWLLVAHRLRQQGWRRRIDFVSGWPRRGS
jgi:hypothetical protein